MINLCRLSILHGLNRDNEILYRDTLQKYIRCWWYINTLFKYFINNLHSNFHSILRTISSISVKLWKYKSYFISSYVLFPNGISSLALGPFKSMCSSAHSWSHICYISCFPLFFSFWQSKDFSAFVYQGTTTGHILLWIKV